MKHKRVLAIVLSLMMVVAFMPSLTFALPADPDTTYTVEITGDQTRDVYNLDDAIEAVKEGGTITGSGGTIDESYEIDAYKDFTLDLTLVTLAKGVEITAADEDACLNVEGQVYSYYKEHEYTAAKAKPTKDDPSIADVTVVCEHGDSLFLEGVEGEKVGEDDEYIYYEATVEVGDQFFTCDWKADNEEEVVYEIDDVDYVQDNSGLAVLKDGNPQFYATYTRNGVSALDANGDKIELEGTITKKTDGEPATTQEYGYSLYDVEFTLPDDTKVEYKGEDALLAFDQDKKAVADTNDVIGIQFYVGGEDGDMDDPDDWSDTFYFDWENEEAWVDYIPMMAVDEEDGSFFYRLIWDAVSTEPEGTEVVGDCVLHYPDEEDSETFACGAADFFYDPIKEKYTDESGKLKTRTIYLPDFEVEGTHEYVYQEGVFPDWAASFDIVEPPTHDEYGLATGKCQYCGEEWTGVDDDYYIIPRVEDHTLQLDAEDKPIEVVVPATCGEPGYSYNVCTADDGNWDEDGTYTLDLPLNEEVTLEAVIDEEDFMDAVEEAGGDPLTAMHPVFVPGSIVPPKHHHYTTSAAPGYEDGVWWVSGATADWEEGDPLVCLVNKHCDVCGGTATYAYTGWTVEEYKDIYEERGGDFDEDYKPVLFADVPMYKAVDEELYIIFSYVPDEGEPYYAASVEAYPAEDCTMPDALVFSADDLDSEGDPISETVESEVYAGPHDYDIDVIWSKSYKAATVLFECEDEDCLGLEDINGNTPKQTRKADVTWRESASSGRTTYTARLDGATVDTVEVYDLGNENITVTVNDGDDIDLKNNNKDLSDLVTITAGTGGRAVEIDKDAYTVEISEPIEGQLTAGYNVLTITANDDATTESISGGVYPVIGATTAVVFCYNKGMLLPGTVQFDGEDVEIPIINKTYDGDTHEISTSAMLGGVTVPDADVEYAVVYHEEYEAALDLDPEDFQAWLENLDYGDYAKVTDVDDYDVFVKISMDGYDTFYGWIAEVVIDPQMVPVDSLDVSAKTIKYGDKLFVTTGDADLDEEIGLSADIASMMSVGRYRLSELVTCDPNYELVLENDPWITIEKRSATVILKDTTKTWNGKEVDLSELYTVDGLAYWFDDLNVEVNTKGGKTAKEPGTYTLTATANNANYEVTVVPATLKINKKSAKIKKVTPKKKTFKANKKTKALAKNKSFKLKAKITGEKAKVTYKKSNKAGKAKITVSKKGKVTAKKGLAKGVYKVKVKATKAATKHYKKATKTVTIKVVVK